MRLARAIPSLTAVAGGAAGAFPGALHAFHHRDLAHGMLFLAARRVLPGAAVGVLAGAALGALLAFLLRRRVAERRFPRSLGELALLAALSVLGAWALLPLWGARRAAGRPSVVLVSLDTLRADRFGPERGLTPRFDRIAADGARFADAVATAPWTLPSHASIFTGRLPFDHGVRWSSSRIQDYRPTLTEHFADAGYRTASFNGDAYVGREYGFAQGFDLYSDRDEEKRGGVGAIASEALAWARSHRDRPFFLFVHTYEPHVPYRGVSHADPRDRGRVPEIFDSPFLARIQKGEIELDETERRYVRGLYDGDVATTDEAIGGLLETLRADGILDDAIVVVMSDHGEALWDDPTGRSPGHGHSLHRCLMHVPLVVRFPGKIPPRAVTTPVSLLDLPPTLLELAGLPSEGSYQGRSLAPDLLAGTDPEPLPIWAESVEYGPDRFLLREGKYTAVLTPDPSEAYGGVHLPAPPLEVFDVSVDPDETTNLADRVPPDAVPVVQRLARRMLAKKRPGTAEEGEAPEHLRETLKSLGYLQ